jgi:anti-sigma regulatory factor (Ser/Thr protein kinase)
VATLLIESDGDECVLTAHGRLSWATVGDLSLTLHKHLHDCVDVLVDLGPLHVEEPATVHAFPAALAEAGGWPAARLVLFGADAPTTELLRAERVPLAVPMAHDLASARPLLVQRPERIARRHELPCDLSATAHARALVQSACTDWRVVGRFPDATLVATELVTNAVVHARTASVLSVSLDRHGLHVAVRDMSPHGAGAIRIGRDHPDDGRGLHLVSELTRAWGVTPHVDGKTVWAVLGAR